MTQALPRIFDQHGKFAEPEIAGLDKATLQRLADVRDAYRAAQEAEQGVKDAIAELKAADEAVKNTQDYSDAHYPPQTRMQALKELLNDPRSKHPGKS